MTLETSIWIFSPTDEWTLRHGFSQRGSNVVFCGVIWWPRQEFCFSPVICHARWYGHCKNKRISLKLRERWRGMERGMITSLGFISSRYFETFPINRFVAFHLPSSAVTVRYASHSDMVIVNKKGNFSSAAWKINDGKTDDVVGGHLISPNWNVYYQLLIFFLIRLALVSAVICLVLWCGSSQNWAT